MLKIGSIRWKGQCARHSRYDPEFDGVGGIKGGCRRCELLFEIYTEHTKLVRLMREFGTRQDARTNRVERREAQRQMSIFDLVR